MAVTIFGVVIIFLALCSNLRCIIAVPLCRGGISVLDVQRSSESPWESRHSSTCDSPFQWSSSLRPELVGSLKRGGQTMESKETVYGVGPVLRSVGQWL